jgi:hypothetical protein
MSDKRHPRTLRELLSQEHQSDLRYVYSRLIWNCPDLVDTQRGPR